MSLFVPELHHAAAELYREEHLGPWEFPGVAVPEPVVGVLDLMPVLDPLGEHAVFVPDAVPVAGQAQRRHRIEKARSKPSQTPVAQGRVGLELADAVEVEFEV